MNKYIKYILTSVALLLLISFFHNCTTKKVIYEKESKEELSIVGTAENTKSGAAVVTSSGEVYYIEGKSNWDKEGYNKKKIRVTGIRYVETTKKENLINSKGEYVQGAEGEKLILKMKQCVLVD